MIKSIMDKQDKLKNYIEKLESLGGRVPQEEELKKIQKDYDLEPEDIKKLEMLVDRHNDRAEIYLHRDNVSGAIEEIERAAQLAPRDPFLHLYLAKLFKNRYENFGFLRRDRLRAQNEAEKTINLDSSLTEASLLVKEMDIINNGLLGKSGRSRPFIVIILTLLLLLTIIIYSNREMIRQWIYRTLNPPQEVHYVPPPQELDLTQPRQIGVESFDFTSAGLDLNIIKSEIAPVNDHWGYSLQGGLTSSSQGINRAAVILRFLAPDYSLLYETDFEITNNMTPYILPGENLPLDFFFFLPVSPEMVEKVTILPGEIELALPEKYSLTDKKVWWRAQKPEGVKFEITERERQSFEGYDSMVHFYILDISHRGMAGINDLELTLEWKDDNEEIKYTEKLNPVNKSGPLMAGREQRAIGFTIRTSLNEEWESLHYDVYVSRIGLD
jgi:tetratricopeptide (TPR) repeat protein